MDGTFPETRRDNWTRAEAKKVLLRLAVFFFVLWTSHGLLMRSGPRRIRQGRRSRYLVLPPSRRDQGTCLSQVSSRTQCFGGGFAHHLRKVRVGISAK